MWRHYRIDDGCALGGAMVSSALGIVTLISTSLFGLSVSASAQQSSATQPKPASEATKAANRALRAN